MSQQWKMYVVECADDTLYTGITTDVERRIREHNDSPKGARYTRSRRPVTLVASWELGSQSRAARAEYAFKALDRTSKLQHLDTDDIFALVES